MVVTAVCVVRRSLGGDRTSSFCCWTGLLDMFWWSASESFWVLWIFMAAGGTVCVDGMWVGWRRGGKMSGGGVYNSNLQTCA